MTIGQYTLVPNPFWGGVLFPLVVFAFLVFWPNIERRFIRATTATTTSLDRPRDAPLRTAIGLGVFTWVALIFLAGADRPRFGAVRSQLHVEIWFFRVAISIIPVVVGFIAYRVCIELQHGEEVERTRKAAEHRAKAMSETTEVV